MVFFTKKQKKLMRERRRKKELALKGLKNFDKSANKKGDKVDDVLASLSAGTAKVTKAENHARSNGSSKINLNDKKKRKRSESTSPENEKNGIHVSPATKKPGSSEDKQHGRSSEGKNGKSQDATDSVSVIVIPSNLSAKEAKKFRKDARRKARSKGQDESKLKFVNEGEEGETDALVVKAVNQNDDGPPKKKQKKSKREFPRINEILEKAKLEQEEKMKKEAREAEENAIPEATKRRYLALDCEMVGIGSDGKKSALARVSITDWYGNVVLDTFVQVPSRVTDFRTHVSGVKPKHIQQTTGAMDAKLCRDKVAEILKGKILVGHALKNDLDALMIQHPKEDIRDTAKYRPYQRYGGNKWRPRKLRDLAKEHCNIIIQQQGESHDSVDDAKATMELFKLARREWEDVLLTKAERKKK